TSSQMGAVFSYELANEMINTSWNLPFSRTDHFGVITADGGTYYMDGNRSQAADANLVNWSTVLTNAIKGIDANAMTDVGLFTYKAVNKAGPWDNILPAISCPSGWCPDGVFPGRPVVLSQYSTIDFVDIHIYTDATLTDSLNS